jgi:hypothetical protein
VKKLLCITLLSLVFHALFYAQNNVPSSEQAIEKKKYTTKRLGNNSIKLDGIPDETAWNDVDWATDFKQFQPNEGQPPSVQTRFKILYDDKFLYIAYRCFDPSPDSIVKRMGRRDEFPGDWVEINLDCYHDLRTAFSFTLSVSGVRSDEFCSSNGNQWDESWNPIWFAKTHIDTEGWTAEVKIPLSQLRYGREPDKVWGIQVMRRLFRKEERSIWQLVPQSSGVWVSGFGELHGLTDVPSQKQVEIAPYVVAQTSKYKKEAGNPFATGKDSKISGGVDGKVAVTSDLILDFTVNPDFGQVEADPSQVRIDGFQSFFDEKRPFFIESRNIFDYQITGSEAGGDYDSDLLFYSRRIGTSPHGSPSLGKGEFADVPQNTSILGAAKFSGKTKDGWGIGILESITQREQATIDHLGEKRKELVEPLSSYFVGRLQKDRDSGNTVLGGIFTAVNRETGLSDMLNKSAYSGGFDFLHFWKNKTWFLRGNLVFSHLEGSKQAILNTQTSFEHLFQRPGATEFTLDENRTSLTGTGGTLRFGKIAGKQSKSGRVFKFETGATFRSPELELNDIGFMLTANEINHFTWAGLQWQKPFGIFRTARVNYNHWLRWDFGGKFLYDAFNTNAHANFKNNWQAGTGLTWNPFEMSNNALRGGSAMLRPSGMGQFGYLQSDSRKKITASLNFFYARGFHNTVKFNDISLTLRAQPMNALNFSIMGGYNNMWRRQDQYVSEANYNGTKRTIVSEVTQNTLQFRARLNYNITPDLTLQYYGQPFITRPTYQNFAYITDPLNTTYDSRFHRYAANEISFNNGNYLVDENHDGKTDYNFSKPDFNFVQFRSNLVLRWEYIAGSEVFLVWSQGSTPDVASDLNTPLSKSLFDNAFGKEAKNIWLVKMTYRFLK